MNLLAPSSKLARLGCCCLALVASASASAADKKRDKVEFTPPARIEQNKPTEDAERRSSRLNFERRESINEGAAAAVGTPLPAPDQVNRSRALQDLIDRQRSLMNGSSVASQAPEDPTTAAEAADQRLTLEEMFQREAHARSNRGMRGEDFPSGRGSEADNFDPGERVTRLRDRLNGDRDTNGLNGNGRGDNEQRSGKRDAFLPGVDGRFVPTGDPLSIGHSNRGSDASSEGLTGRRSLSLSRDAEETRSRMERMDSFRKLLGTAGDSPLRAGIGYSADPAGRGSGVSGVTGAGTPGAGTPRSLGEAFGGRSGPVSAPIDPLSASRGLALPIRSPGLELPTGRAGGNALDTRLDPAPVRAIDLFRQKHDARIPSRDF